MITRIRKFLHLPFEDVADYEVPPFFIHEGWAGFMKGEYLTQNGSSDTLDA